MRHSTLSLESARTVVGASILVLRGSRGPSAVGFTVRPVVVDAVQRERRMGLAPHVCEKVDVGVAPPWAHSDPAPAVVREVNTIAVVASREHVHPGVILGRAFVPMSGAIGHHLSVEAAATLCVPLTHGWSSELSHRSTVAAAPPHTKPTLMAIRHAKNGESTKPQSGHVYKLRHAGYRIIKTRIGGQ